MRVFVVTKRTLLIAAAVLILIAAGIIVAVTAGGDGGASQTSATMQGNEYELEVLAGKRKELPVYSVNRDDKKIALTIDAAWEDDKTPFILEQLDQAGIKATFYVKSIFAKGHELGNHTDTHPHMSKIDSAKMQKELTALDDKMEKLTGKRCKTFRAPYGEYNDTVITTTRAMGYVPVQWDIDTIDWKQRSTDTILASVIPKLHPGAIILCHNNGYNIEEYLPKLIAAAKEQGYEFVTVSELLLPGETMIDVNGVQKVKGSQAIMEQEE